MEILSNVPEWVGSAGQGAAVLLAVWLVSQLIMGGILPLMRELNRDRDQVADERRGFYEKEVMPTLQNLVNELKAAMTTQREQYEAKLTLLERERNAEREKLIEQIKQLTAQVQALTERITRLEEEGKSKDREIESLRAERDDLRAELDVLKAELAAVEAARTSTTPTLPTAGTDIKPPEGKPDAKAA